MSFSPALAARYLARKYFFCLLLWPMLGLAQSPADPYQRLQQLRDLQAKLHFETGDITLPGGVARVSLPENFRYLSPAGASTVLQSMWGNPPGGETLGMIVPSGMSMLDPGAWAVVITYDADGYVKDEEADKINYTTLLGEMKEATRKASAERIKQGFAAIDLVGWAEPPRYDKETHKMYWAKEITFGAAPENTLNYNIRVLGRRGVLVLNAVAPMSKFPEIQQQMPSIVKMANFTEGNRYADFNHSTDKVAAYGLAALVAGGIAAKAGLFKLLWVGLLAAKKFIIIGCAAIASYFKKIFKRKSPPAPAPVLPPPDIPAE